MRIRHDGIELNVEVDGPEDGPPVAFVHGATNSALDYDWLPAEITLGRRIMRIDLRGHGLSEHAPGTYASERYAADVAEILRAVAGRPAVLVGHSLGGIVGWAVAQAHPELLSGALLEEPPLYFGDPSAADGNVIASLFAEWRDRTKGWQAAGVDARTAAAEIAATPIGPELTIGDVFPPEGLLAMAESNLRVDPAVLDTAIDGTAFAADVTSPVSVPVLLLAAENEPMFRLEDERRLAASHPSVRVVRMPGAGHGIHQEAAIRPAYVEHLASFLREHAPSSLAASQKPAAA